MRANKIDPDPRGDRRERRRRRWRRRLAVAGAVVVTGAAVWGFLALAYGHDAGRLARGTTVDGVQVGQLTPEAAVRRLRDALGSFPRPVTVTAAGRRHAIAARRVGARIDYRAAVERALARREHAGLPERAWRAVTSHRAGIHEHAGVVIDRSELRRAVAGLARIVRRRPRDARLRVTPAGVHVRRGHDGVRLTHRRQLIRRIAGAFLDRRRPHHLRAAVRRTPPHVFARDVWRRHPIVVAVSRRGRFVRVFVHARPVATYAARAGSRDHPSPLGRCSITSIDPAGGRLDCGTVTFRRRGAPPTSSVHMRVGDLARLARRVQPGTFVVVAR